MELNFPISIGLSGAPLISDGDQGVRLFGVCVATLASETLDYEDLRIESDGKEYRERKIRIEQYGIAEGLWQLRDWIPATHVGRRLCEINVVTER